MVQASEAVLVLSDITDDSILILKTHILRIFKAHIMRLCIPVTYELFVWVRSAYDV